MSSFQIIEQKLYEIGLLNQDQELHPDEVVNDQLQSIAYDKKWEFPRRKLKLGISAACDNHGIMN